MPTTVDVPAEVARMRRAVTGAFAAAEAAKARDPHHVGISSVGACRRATAYALAGVPVTEPPAVPHRAAYLGTSEHAGLLPWLVGQYPGSVMEQEVVVTVGRLRLVGHIDLDIDEAVWDLKTVGEWRLQSVRRRGGPFRAHRLQVGTYALARLQAGRPPSYVGWLYLDRASGAEEVIVEPFTNAYAAEVLEWLEWLECYRAAPDHAPADEDGPGMSIVCDGCPWLRRCWGPDARPGDTGALTARDDPATEQAGLDYLAAAEAEKAAKRVKDLAVARLEGRPHGAYGRVSYRRGQTQTVDDPWAAAAELRRRGLPVPQTTKRGSIRVKLLPTPAPDLTPRHAEEPT